MKPIKSPLIKKTTLVTHTLLVLAATLLPLFSPFVSNKAYAVEDSIKIYDETTSNESTQCRFVLKKSASADGRTNFSAYDGLGIFSTDEDHFETDKDKSSDFKDDFDAVKNRYNDGQQIYYIILEPENQGNNSDNEAICTPGAPNAGGGILFSRPSDPTKFFGYLRTKTLDSRWWSYYGLGAGAPGTLLRATLNPSSATVSLSGGNRLTQYRVYASPDNPNILSDPIFTTTAPGGGGFCRDYVVDEEYDACMTPSVMDFNTISYRAETYTLRSWRGDDSGNDYMVYLLTSAIEPRKPLENVSDNVRPTILVPINGELDLNLDGGQRKYKAREDFIDELKNLPSTLKVKFKDYDLSGGKIDLGGNSTTDDSEEINLSTLQNFKIMFRYYSGDNTVVIIPNNPGSNEKKLITGNFSASSDTSKPLRYEAPKLIEGCATGDAVPRIDFTSDPKTAENGSTVNATWSIPNNDRCEVISAGVVVYIDSTGASAPPPANTTTDDGETTAIKSCEDDIVDFGIIVCFILNGLDKILGVVENVISNQLIVDQNKYSTLSSGDDTLYQAWLSVARISSVLIAIISLVMILGTSLGGYKLFEPYTVKKVLPRLVIAAIAIWLSWAFITTYIEFINVLGRGVADLLWTPFGEASGKPFQDYGLSEVMGNGQSLGEDVAGIAGLGITGYFAGLAILGGGVGVLGLLSSLIPVVIFMFIGFLVLILRQALIIFLLVLAPVAIASWVLPNTDGVWKKWSKLLNQLLFMFPLFMGILAAGKIFAYITSQQNSGNPGFFDFVVSVAGYVTPFVLLPAIFKSSGGALSKVTGALNARGSKWGQKAAKPIDDRVKARRETVAKDKRMRALQAIGANPEKANFRNRWRVGALGPGVAVGKSRDAIKNQNARLASAGVAEFEKEEEAKVQEAFDVMSKSGDYNDKVRLAEMASLSNPKTNSYQKQAALRRLAQMGADKEVRDLRTEYQSSADEKVQKQWTNFSNSGDYYNGFKEKAPDLIKPNVFGDSPSVSTEAAAKWSTTSWENAFAGAKSAEYRDLAQKMVDDPSVLKTINSETLRHLASQGISPRQYPPGGGTGTTPQAPTSGGGLNMPPGFTGGGGSFS